MLVKNVTDEPQTITVTAITGPAAIVDALALWKMVRSLEAQAALHAVATALGKPWAPEDQRELVRRMNAIRQALGLTPYDESTT